MSNSLVRHLESREKLRKKMIVNSILNQKSQVRNRKRRVRNVYSLIQIDKFIDKNPWPKHSNTDLVFA